MTSGIPFVKGHGTENDFVVLPDLDAALNLTDGRVAALCDRRRGLGADGVLRVVRAKAVEDRPPGMDDDLWFMDYRNADGSLAEMCGNGLRVFARYLVETGIERAHQFDVGTRAGVRSVVVHADATVTVDMGQARIVGPSVAHLGDRDCPGLAVDVGNPHLVCPVTADALATLDLTVSPGHDERRFPHGVNVELIASAEPGQLSMRVHERGVGETRSCGTGTVAATAAHLYWLGERTGRVAVDVPGGRVHVTLDERTSTLTGPVAFVARGELDAEWWRGSA